MLPAGKGVRALTRQVSEWLQDTSLAASLAAIAQLPPEKAIKPLFSCLCSCEPLVKWHAVSAMGQAVAALANQEMESARVVIRRFMWMLNDESGGIGWGVPEAMGEVLACHPRLADEYTHILVSFMREDGFFLELETLQQGLMWGVARHAAVYADLLRAKQAVRYLLPYLNSSDAVVRGLACLALGRLGASQDAAAMVRLLDDQHQFTRYESGEFVTSSVGALASQAIKTPV